jgi:4-diphosphocytidyl-2-C-methyl-D-erythritol kinase
VINQFESSVIQQYAEIEALRKQLYSMGAVYASMSGSGSCVFGFFNELPSNYNRLFPASFLTFSQQF